MAASVSIASSVAARHGCSGRNATSTSWNRRGGEAMKKSSRDDSGNTADGAMRDQEVLRANRELAAYFKGLRTEREARAALKIIKAFIKHRERSDAARR